MSLKQFFNWAGDEIGNLGTSIDQRITQPVFKVAEDVVQAALSDPIGTIAKVAAVATGNAWALPIISAAQTAAAGGDIGDIIKSAAIAYVAYEAGAYAGNYFSDLTANYLVTTGTDAANIALLSNVAQSAATGAIASSITAVAQGQDPIEALIKGGLTGGLTSAASQGLESLLADIPGFEYAPDDKVKSAFQRATKSAILVGAQGGDPAKAFGNSLLMAAGTAGYQYVKDKLFPDTDALIEANDDYKNKAKELADNYQTQNSAAANYNAYLAPIQDAYRNYQQKLSLYNSYKNGKEQFVREYSVAASVAWAENEYNILMNRLAKETNSAVEAYNNTYNTYNPLAENALKQYNDAKAAAPDLERIVGIADEKLATAVKTYQQNELINTTIVLDALQEFDDAQFNYKQETGQDLPVEALTAAAKSGDVLSYVDNLYTTEAEAKDIWKATVGTEPTEYDLLGLIGLDTGQVTSQVQGIADDRKDTTGSELDSFINDIGKGRISLTNDEYISLLGKSETEAQNYITGKYNAFVEDFNTVTATEAQQRWEDAGNVRPMTPDEMFAMLAGNHDTADQIAQRTADFEQEVFNGNAYATQEDARTAAKDEKVFGQYLYNGKIYSVDQEVPYKSNAATREQAVYDAIRNNKGLVEWDGKILKVPQDYDAALKTIRNSPTYIDAYNNAVRLLGPDAPFDWGDENFRTKQAFDASSFTDKGAAALAAYQNNDKSFVFSDGKTYNIPDNFDQIAGDALLEEASMPLRNAALADLLRPEIQAAQEERLQADAKVTVQDAWNNSFGKLGIPMPEPGTEGYESFVSFALGSTGGMIKNAIGASHWLQTFASNQNGSNLTDEQIAEYGDFAGAGTEAPEDIRKSDAYKFAKFLEQTVKQTTPEGQQQYEDFKNKTEGMSIFNKVAMGAIEAAKGNYLWITNMALSEAPEDVLTGQLLARAAYKLTGSAGLGLGINTVVDMAQATGGAYAEQLEQELAKGTPYEIAVLRAAAIAPVMGSLEAAGEFVGDKMLLKQLADSNITGLQTYLKQTGRTLLAESLGEGFSSGAQEAVSQFYNTGKFDIDGINNAIVVGSFVGPAAATISLSPNAASRVVGTMYDGTAATVQDLINRNPNLDYSTLNRIDPIFDFGGNQVSIDQLGNVLDNNATNPNFTPAGYITNLNNLGEAGYIDVTAPDIALAVTLAPDANTLTTQLQNMGLDFGTVLNIADTKFDDAITTRDEAGSLTGTGQVIGTDPNTGEALVQLPDGSVTVVTNPGAEVGQTINVAPPVTENQVKQIVNEAIGNIQFPAGITTEDVTKAVSDYAKANPGLSAQDVASQVNNIVFGVAPKPTAADATAALRLVTNGQYDAKYDVNGDGRVTYSDALAIQRAVITGNTSGLAADSFWKTPTGGLVQQIQADVDKSIKDAIAGIQFPQGLTTDDVASEIKKYMEANPGLSTTDVANAVATELSKLPDYATPTDVTAAIENAVGKPATEDEAATGIYKAIDDAIAGIQFPAGITKEDVAAEIKAYAEANPGLSTLDVTNAVAEELKKLPAYATPTDVTTALNTALADYATKTYIDDAIKGIVFPQGLTKDDVAAEIKAFADANPGLSLDQVTTAITTELGKLPDYATPDDVATALDNAIGKPATADAPATGLYADLAGVGEQVTELADILGTPAVADDPSTPEDESRDPTGVFRQVADAVAAGESATDALARIIGSPATGTAEASGLYKRFEDQGLDIAALEEVLGQPATDDTDASGIYAEIAKSQAALTEQIGEISATIGAPATEGTEATGVFKLIAENEAAGLARDDAIQKAINDYARDTGLDIEALNQLVGSPATDTSDATGIYGAIAASESALGKQITGVEEELSGQISGLEGVIGTPATEDTEATGVFKLIADNEAAGLARDEAIQKAVTDYARDTGLSIDALSDLVGSPATDTAEATGIYGALAASEAALSGQITGVGEQVTGLADILGTPATEDTEATGVFKLINDAEAAGIARDDAIQAIIGGPATESGPSTGLYGELEALGLDLGTIQQTLGAPGTDTTAATGLYGALETGLTGVETRLSKQITGVESNLTQQIQDVATVLGKPAQAVTQADIDLVNQMIQGQAQTDLTYDANRDGVIDQSDVDFLTSITTGTEPPEWPAGTRWAPTGVYGQIARLGADLTRQLEEQELARQAAAEEAERAAQGRFQQQQRQQRTQQLVNMLGQPGGWSQKVDVKAPEVVKLGPQYTGLYEPLGSIFRSPEQQQLFMSPYGNYFDGGEVTEDELLAIVRG